MSLPWPAISRSSLKQDKPGTIGAPIASYKASGQFKGLSDTSRVGYTTRLEMTRADHGHRAVTGLNRDRIKTFILDPLTDRPGAALDTIKKLRILVKHAIDKGWLKHDLSIGIKRPEGIRRSERRPMPSLQPSGGVGRLAIGTKQRTADALMLNLGTARVDTHL